MTQTMPGDLQPLAQNFRIADANGNPTLYFIRWAQQRQIDIASGITAGEAQQLIDDWAAARMIIAGVDLSGGGDLSADVTIDHENSGVAAGTYTSPTITVNARGHVTAAVSGGGGSAQSEAAFNAPNLSAYSWFNQGTSTATADAIGTHIVWQVGGTTIRSLATAGPGTAAYDVYMRASWLNVSNTMHIGLCLRQSSNNRHIGVHYIPQSGNPAYYAQSYNGTTFNSNHGSIGTNTSADEMWFRIRVNSATNYDFYISKDGIDWLLVVSGVNASAFITPDQIGVIMYTANGSRDSYCRISYFGTATPTV